MKPQVIWNALMTIATLLMWAAAIVHLVKGESDPVTPALYAVAGALLAQLVSYPKDDAED